MYSFNPLSGIPWTDITTMISQGESGKDSKAVSSCDSVLARLQADLEGLTNEADELRAFGNEALGENERLQKENEDLRKSCEDAVLDQCVLVCYIVCQMSAEPSRHNRACSGASPYALSFLIIHVVARHALCTVSTACRS